MARLLVVSMVVLTSCEVGLDIYKDSGAADTAAPMGAVSVDDIDPTWGPPDGGTVVTIQGAGFTSPVQVWFGGVSVVTAVVDDGTLIVESPEWPREESVDLRVVTDNGQAIAEHGFTYLDLGNDADADADADADSDADADADADADSDADADADTDTDPKTPPPTGLVGGLVEMQLMQIACPACFGLVSDLDVSASVAMHDGSATSWLSWIPATGACALNPSVSPPAEARHELGDWVYLDTSTSSMSLQRSTGADGTYYEAFGLGETDFLRSTYHDLNVTDGGAFGPFVVPNAALTPAGFKDIQPWQLLLVNLNDAFQATMSRTSGGSLTWSPNGPGTFVVIVDVFTDGGAWQGMVVCHDYDTGAMTVPSSMLNGFLPGSLLAVYMFRYEMSETILPTTGDTLESVAKVGVVGTATLVP